MTSSTTKLEFAPFHKWDRDFFLLILAAIWALVLAGFVPDMLEHLTGKHAHFAPVVYFHGLAFFGWLMLLTAQLSLARSGQRALHMRLGVLAVLFIPLMVVLSIWTGLVMAAREMGTPDSNPAFQILTFILASNFAIIASAGFLLRKNAAAHRRLMLLATVFISSAGSARLLAPQLSKLTGNGVLPFMIQNYVMDWFLVATIVIFDFVTRRRLQPEFMLAACFGIGTELLTSVIYNAAAWKPIALHLLGH